MTYSISIVFLFHGAGWQSLQQGTFEIKPLPILPMSADVAVWKWKLRGQAQGNEFPEVCQIEASQPFVSGI
jgi:hypothetical protein